MTEFSVLVDPSAWWPGFERRLRAAYGAVGYPEAAAEFSVGRMRDGIAEWTVTEILSAGTRVGFVAVTMEADTPTGRIGDLWVDAAHAGQGHERAARSWAEGWCAGQGATRVAVRLVEPDGLFADYPVRGQLRMRAITAAATPLDGVTARPMTPAEYPGWLAAENAAFAADIVRSGAMTPDEARRKADNAYTELIPQGLDTEDHSILVLEHAGARIGTGWLKHRHLPGVTFGFSLEIDEEHRGKGYGRAAMAVGERATVEAGDAALMFNVFGGNEVAMSLYTSAGYPVVEETRSIDLPPGTGALP